MKKILVLTVENDLHTEKVSSIIKQKYNEEILELNRERYGKDWIITVLVKKSGPKIYINYKNNEYSQEDIASLWNRRSFYLASAQDNLSPIDRYISSQTAIHVNSAFRLLGTKKIFCMNSLESDLKANSKCLQAQYAYDSGLMIPDTFQGGSPEILSEFSISKEKENLLCIKPIESSHIKIDENTTLAHYTKIFESRGLKELESVKQCPVIIQDYIKKDYEIRATIVGDKIFSASIDTKNASEDAKIDFRHYDWANTPYYPISLPHEINDKLISIMRKFGLEYGAVDLIKNQNGEYYFLEVNSQGQWLWVEDMTGLKISESIADYLWFHK